MILSKIGFIVVFTFFLTIFGSPIDKKEIQTNFDLSDDTHDDTDFNLKDGLEDLRSLRLGQINFLHTTDTHGWLGSHPNQINYNANWGHFISFIELFKRYRIDKEKQDILIIDTGDKHDGSGLSDATAPNGIASTKIFNEMDYDLLTLGNHELYNKERVVLEYYTTALSSKFKDKYVASNVDFILKNETLVPFGNKYVYMETPVNHLRIIALSFIFNFQNNNPRAKVTPVLQSLQSGWFQNILTQYPECKLDMIVIFGHIPARDKENHELKDLHDFLRQYYPNIVIQYFSGHTHIRDFVEFDSKSTCLQSGRFSETVGFLSIDNVTDNQPNFSRSYIDFNKQSFKFHSNSSHLYTKRGSNVIQEINLLKKSLQLDEQFGMVPQNYYMMTRPIESEENIYHLIKHKVLPKLKSTSVPADELSFNRIVMLNTGAIRFDLYKGPFTRDTEFSILPFDNNWNYLKLEKWVAIQIEDFLNHRPVISMLNSPEQHFLHDIVSDTEAYIQSDRYNPNKLQHCPFINNPKLSEGYTTNDDYGCDGDDTPHSSQRIYPMPNVIQSNTFSPEKGENNRNEIIDFIFFSYLKKDILHALRYIDPSKSYDESEVRDYGGKPLKQLLRDYIVETNT
ncbi:Smn1p PWA37_000455 [Arxiozyma heterogenica]|uniref:Putative 5'-nucleotidase C-terminal domain-containing protein n=1 Tax=Arxiozyma heterogenica TaxID=278026 RepID=A0AAN7WEZ6_9SACH|nr:hypothetical protein RI543_003957 [Kazachstania heterogenica]